MNSEINQVSQACVTECREKWPMVALSEYINELNDRNTAEAGRTHQKLSNEPRYRSPFIGDLTRGTF